jgi:hypothetical protein
MGTRPHGYQRPHFDLKKHLGTKQIATNISYEIVNNILKNLSSLVVKIGLHVGAIDREQILGSSLFRVGNGMTMVHPTLEV